MKVAWFSAGVSSFCAAYFAKPDRIVYIDVANQHPDSLRFLMDAQELLGQKIEVLRDMKFGGSVDTCIEHFRYINSDHGAPCTLNLKKRIRQEWERQFTEPITYVWGYDVDEVNRAKRIAENEFGFAHEFPLIDRFMDKAACHGFAEALGLKRPAMYDLGYANNNCIGCVKGGMGYWNKIRVDFPDVFKRRARQEREIGHSCIHVPGEGSVFLDELDPNRGDMSMEVMPACNFVCLEVEP